MDDTLLVFFILLEFVAMVAGVGLGYLFGRRDKILGVYVDEPGH